MEKKKRKGPLDREGIDQHFSDQLKELQEKYERQRKDLYAEQRFFDHLPDIALPYTIAFGSISDIYGKSRTVSVNEGFKIEGSSGPVTLELIHELVSALPPVPMKYIEPERYAGTIATPEYIHEKGVRAERTIAPWWVTFWDFGHNGQNTTLCWATKVNNEILVMQIPFPNGRLIGNLEIRREEFRGGWRFGAERLRLTEKASKGSHESRSASGSDQASSHYLVTWEEGWMKNEGGLSAWIKWLNEK